MIEYTNRFDRLSANSMAGSNCRAAELKRRSIACQPIAAALEAAAAPRVRSYHEKQPLQGWQYEEADGTLLGQKITPARPRRPLCARRQGRLSVIGADECHSGACRRCRQN